MNENGKQVVSLQECPRYVVLKYASSYSSVKACGRFTNSNGSQYGCASGSLMEKHGVSEPGCADDLIHDPTGKTADVEICYCIRDGCNKNCTCSDKSDHESSNFEKPPRTNLSVTLKPGSVEAINGKFSTNSVPNSRTKFKQHDFTNTNEPSYTHAAQHSSGKYTSSPTPLIMLIIIFLLVTVIFG